MRNQRFPASCLRLCFIFWIPTLSELSTDTVLELQSILESYAAGEVTLAENSNRLQKLIRSEAGQIPEILAVLGPLMHQLTPEFLESLGRACHQSVMRQQATLDDSSLDAVEEALLRSSPNGKWYWLALLASIQSSTSLNLFVREILEIPAMDPNHVLMAFAPLMQQPEFDPEWLFPELFAGLQNSVLAPIVLDFANFCVREGLGDEHPAESRYQELVELLEQLGNRLAEIENDPTSWSEDPQQVSRMVSDSVALIVALCDTMSNLGREESVAVIEKIAGLRHRRVRAEATFALARLGVLSGEDRLLELVKEPVSRLRVIQYANELGIEDRIEESYLSESSRAESELALWLTQPGQMGVPPTEIELVDRRRLYWPGYDEPVDCFLFRFVYRMGDNRYSNLAMVGPLIHAFLEDLESIRLDDVYAAFAGWQVEHDEIVDLDLDQLSPHRETDLFRLKRRLHDFGGEAIEPRLMGLFFGEIYLVAQCTIDGKPIMAAVDGNQIRCFPLVGDRPVSVDLVSSIYQGTRLIDTFNA